MYCRLDPDSHEVTTRASRASSDRRPGPVPILRVAPEWPGIEIPNQRSFHGECAMTFDVIADGSVDAETISADCTHGALARSAERAIGRWRFDPATVDSGRETVEMTLGFDVVTE